MDRLFPGIEAAQIIERGQYFKPGFDGDVIIRKVMHKRTNNAGEALIVELEVASSNHPEHPVGFKGTWFQGLAKNANVAYNSMLEFACAAFGISTSDKAQVQGLLAFNPKTNQTILEDHYKYAFGKPDENSFTGKRIRVRTTQISTKSGNPFTRHAFSKEEGEAGPVTYVPPVAAPEVASATEAPNTLPDMPAIPPVIPEAQ